MSLVGFQARNHPQQVAAGGAKLHVDDMATPPEIFDPLNERFGFTLDVAASAHNAKCPRYFTLEDDGLTQLWARERVWCRDTKGPCTCRCHLSSAAPAVNNCAPGSVSTAAQRSETDWRANARTATENASEHDRELAAQTLWSEGEYSPRSDATPSPREDGSGSVVGTGLITTGVGSARENCRSTGPSPTGSGAAPIGNIAAPIAGPWATLSRTTSSPLAPMAARGPYGGTSSPLVEAAIAARDQGCRSGGSRPIPSDTWCASCERCAFRGERVFCNPPYSNIEAWVEKAWAEWRTCEVGLIVMLLPANRTEQRWWQEHVEPFRDGRDRQGPSVEFLPGRPRFIRYEDGIVRPNERPPFGCCLLIWGGPVDRGQTVGDLDGCGIMPVTQKRPRTVDAAEGMTPGGQS
jgi:hypothetical protein